MVKGNDGRWIWSERADILNLTYFLERSTMEILFKWSIQNDVFFPRWIGSLEINVSACKSANEDFQLNSSP